MFKFFDLVGETLAIVVTPPKIIPLYSLSGDLTLKLTSFYSPALRSTVCLREPSTNELSSGKVLLYVDLLYLS